LNQSTHPAVAYSTSSTVRKGLRGLMSAVLYRPLMVTANQQDSLPKPDSTAQAAPDVEDRVAPVFRSPPYLVVQQLVGVVAIAVPGRGDVALARWARLMWLWWSRRVPCHISWRLCVSSTETVSP